ncbi:hypothetical protein F5Y06DRAFT_233735 [Hypoxylon sp. FL0890]|nr:hypothetical protein F5Y06DRAFT_233735 [Hypoxylon sp. FL0890]
MLVDSLARRLSSKHRKSIPVAKKQGLEEHDEQAEADEEFENFEEPYRAPAYPYRQLDETEVRLLRILPGTGPIECIIHQMPLAEVICFYALSYVWGDATEKETIILEGQPFHITKNLYEALYQFRQRPYDIGHPKDYFWVDAICINQEDVDERSRQVSRMMDIYHAGHVVIWLGHVKELPAENLFKKLIRKTRSSRVQISPDKAVEMLFKKTQSMWVDWEPVDDDDNVIIDAEFGDAYNAIIGTIMSIIKRPWFQRVWTIQEACLDTYPTIYVGRHSVHLKNLMDIWKILALEHRFLFFSSGSARMVSLHRIDLLYKSSLFNWDDNPKKMNIGEVFITLLRVTGKKSSTDPRDQLYGLLGLLKYLKEEEPPEELMPDYRLPYQDVYWNYAAFLFNSVGDLKLLDCERNELQHVPSWVPDFRYISHGPDLIREESVHVSDDKRTLHVRGCVLGTFSDVITGCVARKIWPTAKTIPTGLPARLRDFEERILKPSAAIRGITTEEAFDDLINNLTRIIDAEGVETFYEVFRRLIKSTGGKRPWYAKKRTTNVRLKEEALADQLSAAFLLLDDGTILGVRREDAEVRPSDIVCAFKGASNPSLVRASGESYTFVGQCDAKAGPLKQQQFDDDFWADKDIQDFRLI